MQVTLVSTSPGVPVPEDGQLVLYMTPEMKKPDARLPYAAQWSFGGKDFHHMMSWITAVGGNGLDAPTNGPGGSSLTYALLLQYALATVPASVGGSSFLSWNIENEQDHSQWATDEQFGWGADTLPLHNPNSPRPLGGGWETAWHCPYDFFIPRAGSWVFNHQGASFQDCQLLPQPVRASHHITIRDWSVKGAESARYTLLSDDEGRGTVRLKAFGSTMPDDFAVTGIKYQLQIRKEGAGSGDRGIVYRKDGISGDKRGAFMLVHEWDGRANRRCSLDTGVVDAGAVVPPGRYVVEWTRISCAQGLVAGDSKAPLLGGVVTVGTIALGEIGMKASAFVPESGVCDFAARLQALPVGTTAFPGRVRIWVDIDEVPHPPVPSPPRLPGQGAVATYSHEIAADRGSPCLLRYRWSGGQRSSISFEDSSPAQSTAPPDRVPNGNYVIRITARPVSASKNYHNSVSEARVLVIPTIGVSEFFISRPTPQLPPEYDISYKVPLGANNEKSGEFLRNLEFVAELTVQGQDGGTALFKQEVPSLPCTEKENEFKKKNEISAVVSFSAPLKGTCRGRLSGWFRSVDHEAKSAPQELGTVSFTETGDPFFWSTSVREAVTYLPDERMPTPPPGSPTIVNPRRDRLVAKDGTPLLILYSNPDRSSPFYSPVKLDDPGCTAINCEGDMLYPLTGNICFFRRGREIPIFYGRVLDVVHEGNDRFSGTDSLRTGDVVRFVDHVATIWGHHNGVPVAGGFDGNYGRFYGTISQWLRVPGKVLVPYAPFVRMDPKYIKYAPLIPTELRGSNFDR